MLAWRKQLQIPRRSNDDHHHHIYAVLKIKSGNISALEVVYNPSEGPLEIEIKSNLNHLIFPFNPSPFLLSSYYQLLFCI
jgi:hypothetical protein